MTHTTAWSEVLGVKHPLFMYSRWSIFIYFFSCGNLLEKQPLIHFVIMSWLTCVVLCNENYLLAVCQIHAGSLLASTGTDSGMAGRGKRRRGIEIPLGLGRLQWCKVPTVSPKTNSKFYPNTGHCWLGRVMVRVADLCIDILIKSTPYIAYAIAAPMESIEIKGAL